MSWQQPPRPEWLANFNQEARHFNLKETVPLDATSLRASAELATGLSDYGEDSWREPFEILCRSLDEEADLNPMGRLMSRSDIVQWLINRLQVIDLLNKHPEIEQQPVPSPMFIVGLPRSGTSILFEVLAQDPEVGSPKMWEGVLPCPPPAAKTYKTDPRIARADALVTQWQRVVPEFASMHELAGDIPAECGLLMTGSFVSDHIAALHQNPSYQLWHAQADLLPAYQWHKKMLQVLQWKNPRKRWLLKAPAHQNALPTLLQVYPDAKIVQTHRDPIKCMASSTSLMGALYYMRSDAPFDPAAFDDILFGQPTAARLGNVMNLRESGVIPDANICDSRYQDLMDDPIAAVTHIYDHFGLALSESAKDNMTTYLAAKPRHKAGEHRYAVTPQQAKDRALFARYQQAYQVPDEV